MKEPNLAASVRARLLNLARSRGENFDFVLNRYASERLLFRLGLSAHADHFILKGATLFAVWSNTPHRPTRDLDLLGTGDSAVETLQGVFREIIATPLSATQNDGLVFDTAQVSGARIKEEEQYEGVRIGLVAHLLAARIPLQIDIGFGDIVTPGTDEIDFPTLLGQNPPRLHVYPRETVIAEKFEAMVKLAQNNSRMKDFYDVWVLSKAGGWDEEQLRRAIKATFARRQTPLPLILPIALHNEFGQDAGKTQQWNAFRRKNGLDDAPDFSLLITELREFLWPLAEKR